MQLIKLFFLTYFTLAENLRDLDEEVDRVRRDEEGKIYENLLSNLSNYTNFQDFIECGKKRSFIKFEFGNET